LEKICPKPMPWNALHKKLSHHAKKAGLSNPPVPLILSGWHFSSDSDKKNRWRETLRWAEDNNFKELAEDIPDHDFYFGE
jgi:hypothetical protein